MGLNNTEEQLLRLDTSPRARPLLALQLATLVTPAILVLGSEWVLRDIVETGLRTTGSLVACAIALLLGYLMTRPLFHVLRTMQRDASDRAQEARDLWTRLEERERLGRDLHDTLGQLAAFLHLRIDTVTALLADGRQSDAEAELAALSSQADDIYRQIRDRIADLRNPPQTGGFSPSIASFLHEFATLHGLSTVTEGADLLERLTPAQAQQTQLIVQEALANAWRHARANRVQIGVVKSDDRHLRVVIQDDGCGFDPSTLGNRPGPSFGLRGMRERAQSLGGELTIESRAGAGTRLILTIPADHATGA